MDFDPSSLNPDFASKLDAFRQLLETQYGLPTDISSGMRSNDTQGQLYAQGRTAPGDIVTNAPPGSSYHNYGAAVDLVPKGMNEKDAAAVLKRAFAENPDLGLTWGGSFKSIYDPFHVQLGVPLETLRNGTQIVQPAVAGPLGANAMAQAKPALMPLFPGATAAPAQPSLPEFPAAASQAGQSGAGLFGPGSGGGDDLNSLIAALPQQQLNAAPRYQVGMHRLFFPKRG